ncbi:Cadherin-13 [Varanus komodoensis]|nr:Cadherin-13 [Varanus komodoensis]
MLQVEITDASGKTIEGPVPLEVIIIDQNDNRPLFREGPYIGHVMEGSPTGKLTSDQLRQVVAVVLLVPIGLSAGEPGVLVHVDGHSSGTPSLIINIRDDSKEAT